MSERRILLLGCGGQVGWELQRALQPLGELMACDRAGVQARPAATPDVDLADPDQLQALLEQVQPQLIVNAAAYTGVDSAERESEQAQRINAHAPQVLARWAQAHQAWLVHYSTDYVYDGSGDQPRREDAPTHPLNVYGRTKLAGDQAIAASGCAHLLLRTSWVYGIRGGNFARTILQLAQSRESLQVIDDQIGAPTAAELLADITAQVLAQLTLGPQAALAASAAHPDSGIYHVAAAGSTSWHGYARHLIERARAQGLALRLGPNGLRPIASADYPSAATRPLNSRLSTHKLQQRFGLRLPAWELGVDRWLDQALNMGGLPRQQPL